MPIKYIPKSPVLGCLILIIVYFVIVYIIIYRHTILHNSFILLAILSFLAFIFFFRLYQTSDSLKKQVARVEPISLNKPFKNLKDSIKMENKIFTEEDLSPIKDLDIDKFAEQASSYFNDPEKYADFITGWFHRWRIKRNTKAVELLDELLIKMRNASRSAMELQEEILKNRVIFKFQAEIALQRLNEEWQLERDGRDLDKLRLEAEKSRQRFIKRLYDELDPNELSESAKVLMPMFNPKYVSKSSSLLSPGFTASNHSEDLQYSDPAEIMQIQQQDKVLEVLIRDKFAKLDKSEAEASMTKEQVEQEKIETELKRHKKDETIKRDKKLQT